MSDKPFRESPVLPVELEPGTEFNFSCKPGIGCFNACCKAIDITLTPYDILRLKRRLKITAPEFLRDYAVPFQIDQNGLPALKLRTENDTPRCLFNTDEGCTVYEDRPTACRYYPVAQLSMRKEDEYTDRQSYAMVREEHCLGHQEEKCQSIEQYVAEQGLDDYNRYNRGWSQLVLKVKSLGPSVGKPSKRSLQLFFMANYDLDAFRIFVSEKSFRRGFALSEEEWAVVDGSDEGLLDFSFRLMRQVLFAEESLPRADGAIEERFEKRKAREKAAEESEEVIDATFDDSSCA
ncbi:YkgJ family cysteine cluster protein [Endothiovibrio diazotrophicus]